MAIHNFRDIYALAELNNPSPEQQQQILALQQDPESWEIFQDLLLLKSQDRMDLVEPTRSLAQLTNWINAHNTTQPPNQNKLSDDQIIEKILTDDDFFSSRLQPQQKTTPQKRYKLALIIVLLGIAAFSTWLFHYYLPERNIEKPYAQIAALAPNTNTPTNICDIQPNTPFLYIDAEIQSQGNTYSALYPYYYILSQNNCTIKLLSNKKYTSQVRNLKVAPRNINRLFTTEFIIIDIAE